MSNHCRECQRLREGLGLYVILRNKVQFTPPDVMEQISRFTGVEYQQGHLISSVIVDMEIALGIRSAPA